VSEISFLPRKPSNERLFPAGSDNSHAGFLLAFSLLLLFFSFWKEILLLETPVDRWPSLAIIPSQGLLRTGPLFRDIGYFLNLGEIVNSKITLLSSSWQWIQLFLLVGSHQLLHRHQRRRRLQSAVWNPPWNHILQCQCTPSPTMAWIKEYSTVMRSTLILSLNKL
jgi:hypothetical protein